MITGNEILKSIENGDIHIEPFNSDFINPNSYDITLNEDIYVSKVDAVLELKKDNSDQFEKITIGEDGYTLLPNRLYIASSNEYTETHAHVPILEGKSSIARLGIEIHRTAGFGDVGFCGKWTLEITTIVPVKIYKDMKIGQISYHEVIGTVGNTYDGKYQHDTGASLSKSYKDFKN